MSGRIISIASLAVALVVAGAPQDAMARHRHHRHAAPSDAAASGVRVSPNPRAAAMRQSEDALNRALASDPVARVAETPGALRDPKTRALVSASLAAAPLPRPELAGLRHRDGGYGWVGPVFWPFATYDIVDAALWGDAVDASFWGYGAADLVTGLFGIYPDDDVTAFARYLSSAGGSAPHPSMLARMCGHVSGDIGGVPVETVRSSLQAGDAQRAALDDLSGAFTQASQQLAASCPQTLPLTAQQRLAAMDKRLDAMIAAVDTVQPRLAAFFAKLDDTQKTRFVALGAPSAPSPATPGPQPGPAPVAAQPAAPSSSAIAAAAAASAAPMVAAQACASAPAVLPWPKAALERAVGRGDAQRKALDDLQAAVAKATAGLAPACQPADATTPPARLAAIRSRLADMRAALATLSTAVGQVYAALDPVQTVDFDAVGSEPARAMAMAAAMQRFRALQSAAGRFSGARSSEANAAERAAPAADASITQAESSPPQRHGGGRRHLARYAHRVPGPVHAIGRVLGALLP
ncbi:MAG: Spy/CpxP family protein refolding chaperone [Xanthobacteraceae bacterium]